MKRTAPPESATPHISRFRRSALVWLAAVAMVAPLLAVSAQAAPASAATPLPDGLSSSTAAGSCWEVKQNYPASASGIYWLLTPALQAPTQFYCDQATNGGGWVLIARGREGWKGQYNGLRSAVALRTVVDGTGAFATAQLPGKTVDALLNGGNVSALPDGVRLRRATNQTGTTYQEVRFTMPKRTRWVWTFGAEHPVGTYSFDGVTGQAGKRTTSARTLASVASTRVLHKLRAMWAASPTGRRLPATPAQRRTCGQIPTTRGTPGPSRRCTCVRS